VLKVKEAYMLKVHPQYITSIDGQKLAVVLPIEEFQKLMDELDELDDIRLYDQAKAADEPSFPIDEAFKMIEAERQAKK
jgi:hypothetical protein